MATVNKPSKQTAKKNPKLVNSDKQTMITQALLYLKGVQAEWHKISWPKWPQVWAQTIVVLVMVSVMTLGLFVLDYSLHFIISNITPH